MNMMRNYKFVPLGKKLQPTPGHNFKK